VPNLKFLSLAILELTDIRRTETAIEKGNILNQQIADHYFDRHVAQRSKGHGPACQKHGRASTVVLINCACVKSRQMMLLRY